MNNTSAHLPDLLIIDQTKSIELSDCTKEQEWYYHFESHLNRRDGLARIKQTRGLLRARVSEEVSERIDLASTLADAIGYRSGLGKLACLVSAT